MRAEGRAARATGVSTVGTLISITYVTNACIAQYVPSPMPALQQPASLKEESVLCLDLPVVLKSFRVAFLRPGW